MVQMNLDQSLDTTRDFGGRRMIKCRDLREARRIHHITDLLRRVATHHDICKEIDPGDQSDQGVPTDPVRGLLVELVAIIKKSLESLEECKRKAENVREGVHTTIKEPDLGHLENLIGRSNLIDLIDH